MSRKTTKREVIYDHPPRHDITELPYLMNSLRSTQAAAEGFVSGQRVWAVKEAEKAVRNHLWDHRERLELMVRNLIR